MSNKIVEIRLEPTDIYTSQKFKLKVKAIRYLTFNELKTLTFDQVKEYTFGQLKGD